MSSQSKAFKVGEKVLYPQLQLTNQGKFKVRQIPWQIETIFPVSQLAVLKNQSIKNQPLTKVQVSLAQLRTYN